MPFSAPAPLEFLKRLGESGEGPYDIAGAALMLSALDHPDRPLQRYLAHLDAVREVAQRELKLIQHCDEAAQQLSHVMAGQFGYEGDRLAYDAPQNADLMAVIDRRRGLPVALGILYLHAARAGGLQAEGLNTPGHFLVRLTHMGVAVMVDPFNSGAVVDRERLGAPPGMGAAPGEPSAGMAVTDAEVLLRLQNNIKLRALQAGDRQRALAIAERMVLIAPGHPELWLDLAHLYEAQGSLGAAKRAYESTLQHAQTGATLHNEAALGLATLKRRLN